MNCPYCRREQSPGSEPSTAPELSTRPEQSPHPSPKRRSLFRRGARNTSWLMSGLLLVLMPKCPLCLAAYIAMITGVSISFTAAAWLRGTLITLCAASLAWLVVRWSLYLYKRAIQ